MKIDEHDIVQYVRNKQVGYQKLYISLGYEITLSQVNDDRLEKFGEANSKVFDYVVESDVKALSKLPLRELNKCNDKGYTPLMWAIITHRNKVARYLIEQNVDIAAESLSQDNVFTLACRFNNAEILQRLLEKYGMKEELVFKPNIYGFHALHFVSNLKSERMLELLMPSATSETIMLQNSYGANCLHWLTHGIKIADNIKSMVLNRFYSIVLKHQNAKMLMKELMSQRNIIGFTPIDWLELYKNEVSHSILTKS